MLIEKQGTDMFRGQITANEIAILKELVKRRIPEISLTEASLLGLILLGLTNTTGGIIQGYLVN